MAVRAAKVLSSATSRARRDYRRHETLLPLAEERGVTIDTSVEMAPTIGSRALLLQLSTNLVHNAIVHNLPGQGTVWVSTSARPGVVELTVENTGETLAPQMVSTLAEPFLRGDERVRADHAGVGLGLAIVERITQAHDGSLTLTPQPPAGSASRCESPPHRLDDLNEAGRPAAGGDDAQRVRAGSLLRRGGRYLTTEW